MATNRAYTTIEQSRKLAEILPLESSDMHYNNGSCRGVDYTEHFSAELTPYQEALHLMKIHKTNFMFQVIPCWSLASLLDVLSYCPDLSKHTDGKWYITTYPNNVHTCLMAYDNPVDACYEMILKLHELNLL